jgi:hypothetical protein
MLREKIKNAKRLEGHSMRVHCGKRGLTEVDLCHELI